MIAASRPSGSFDVGQDLDLTSDEWGIILPVENHFGGLSSRLAFKRRGKPLALDALMYEARLRVSKLN